MSGDQASAKFAARCGRIESKILQRKYAVGTKAQHRLITEHELCLPITDNGNLITLINRITRLDNKLFCAVYGLAAHRNHTIAGGDNRCGCR